MQKLSSPIKLIKDSFEIFFEKKNLVYFASIYLLLIPFQILFSFQGSIKYVPLIGVVILVNILYLVVYLLTLVAGISAVRRVIAKEPLDLKKTYVFAWKNLWKFSLLATLVFLATFGGFILLIIPGIIIGVWLSFANFVFIDQGLGVKASMGKSRELVKGRFWAVFGRLFVFGLFSGLVGIMVSVVPFGIGSGIVNLAGALFILPSFLLYKELSAR
jgi:hypothetical protein